MIEAKAAAQPKKEEEKLSGFFVSGYRLTFKHKGMNLAPDFQGQYHPKTAEEKAFLEFQATRGYVTKK